MKKKRSARRSPATPCPACGGQVLLRKATGYAETYPDGMVLTVSDALALPQCGTCREVYLNTYYEKKVEEDLRLDPEKR
jgi:hypothetical protein